MPISILNAGFGVLPLYATSIISEAKDFYNIVIIFLGFLLILSYIFPLFRGGTHADLDAFLQFRIDQLFDDTLPTIIGNATITEDATIIDDTTVIEEIPAPGFEGEPVQPRETNTLAPVPESNQPRLIKLHGKEVVTIPQEKPVQSSKRVRLPENKKVDGRERETALELQYLRELRDLFQLEISDAKLNRKSIHDELKEKTPRILAILKARQRTMTATPPRKLLSHAQMWQQKDILKYFATLETSITSLARALHRHISQSNLFQYRIQTLSDSCFLIKGASKELWAKRRPLLLQGAIWSILLETIFSNEFEVFGEGARHLAKEWVSLSPEHHSATWRSSTAQTLSNKAGIIQYDTDGPSHSAISLREMLSKCHSLDDSVSTISDALIKTRSLRSSESGGQEATRRAQAFFKDSDPRARQSLHNARQHFVCSLRCLTDWFVATVQLSSAVERVITDAQVLAILSSLQFKRFTFVVPTREHILGHVNEGTSQLPLANATCCTYIHDGPILFTHSPGLRESVDADPKRTTVLRPAQVFSQECPEEGSPEARPKGIKQATQSRLVRPMFTRMNAIPRAPAPGVQSNLAANNAPTVESHFSAPKGFTGLGPRPPLRGRKTLRKGQMKRV